LTKTIPEKNLGNTTTDLVFYSEDDRNSFLEELRPSGEVHELEMAFAMEVGSVIQV